MDQLAMSDRDFLQSTNLIILKDDGDISINEDSEMEDEDEEEEYIDEDFIQKRIEEKREEPRKKSVFQVWQPQAGEERQRSNSSLPMSPSKKAKVPSFVMDERSELDSDGSEEAKQSASQSLKGHSDL